MSEITPVFVIGMNRSGTKWLSNILCGHSDVIGVQSQRHGGILETNMLTGMPAKFNLSYADDYVAFVDLWSRSDFFRLTGIDKKTLLEQPWPSDFFAIFTTFMNRYARQNGKRFWLQKVDPESGLELIGRSECARLIVIERDFLERVKSTLQLKANQGVQPSTLEAVYDTVTHAKMNKRILRQENSLRVRYEQIRHQPKSVLRDVCDHIGISFEPEMLDVRFHKNTSFRGVIHSSVDYASRHPARLRLMAAAMNLIPLSVMQAYRKLKLSVLGAPPPPFAPGSFSELREELSNLENVNRDV